MCGIVGLLNWKQDVQSNIDKMNSRMQHRGPDANGKWISEDGKVAFGHQRLSIVDLSPCGAQPMVSHSGRYVICYNGEVYNYKKIAKKLLDEKVVTQFRGTSDTEVILEAFEAWGIKDTLAMCKGMFGIAVYDMDNKTLYLTRDRVGEKPLYYGFVNGSFVFASDLGSIAVLDGFNNEINSDVLNIYFVHGYIPAPYSIYRDIYKLEPGKILTLKEPYNNPQIDTYWSMKEVARRGQTTDLFKGSFEEAALGLEERLTDAIKEQMVADVPVGAFLSSGIDSSTIVSLMQSVSSQPVRTFTIGVEDKKYNEAEVAADIARHLGTNHTEMYITEDDAKKVIPNISYMYGEPFADSSQIPTYLVSKLTRQHVTVSLSGDAGDELFCGYDNHISIDRIWHKMNGIPYPLRSAASSVLTSILPQNESVFRTKALLLGARNEADLFERSNAADPNCMKIALSRKVVPFVDNTYELGYLDDTKSNVMLINMLMYHPDDILVKVDRAGMAVSLESRIPLLDRDVVEYAWTLPIDYKYRDGVTKRVMRDILYRHVPKELMDRPKRGFSIPIHKWLKEPELRAWAESLIDRKTLESQGLLNPDIVWAYWNAFIERDEWKQQIWFILMFQQWMCDRSRV